MYCSWNTADGGKICDYLKNCTNNDFESYDLKINEKCSTPHPSFSVFLMAIEEDAHD